MTLVRLLRRIIDTQRLLTEQQELIHAWEKFAETLHQDLRRTGLEHTREMEGIVAAWLISMERPEEDIRDDLTQLLAKLGHQAARLEEHVV